MQQYSKINRRSYERIKRLIYVLRDRYKNKSDFYVGIIAIQAGQKLLKNYYRTHKNSPDLLEWRALIFENMTEFQKTLNEYKI